MHERAFLLVAVVDDDVGCVGRGSRGSLSFASCEARLFVFHHLECSSAGYPSKLLLLVFK